MKENSIGIFDSGFGGLTAMRHIRSLLPAENIIYFGDTARLPYGNKSPDTILRYSEENISFLIEKKIKILVIACHTACTAALDHLRKQFNIPIIGIMEQGIEEAVLSTRSQKIGVLGTRTTIASNVYQHRLKLHLPKAAVYGIACPLFVPLVEEGFNDHHIASLIVKEYLEPLKDKGIDTLLLGCTHYPLLLPLLQKGIGESVCLIDPAAPCAKETKRLLASLDLLNPQTEGPRYEFYVSDDPEKFRSFGKIFLQHPIDHISCVHSSK
jgi:glutamate racemase